jgi:hypothetical protein
MPVIPDVVGTVDPMLSIPVVINMDAARGVNATA